MQRLTDDVKAFIVTHLAMYDTPMQVVAAVKEEFGVEIDRQSVWFYDPTRAAGEKAGKKWQDLFHATREKFIDTASEIPIAIKAVRLRRLDRMATNLERNRNVLGAAQLMKQAAEDIGGVYTNRRELTGKNGDPLIPELTADERRDRVVGIFREAAKRRDMAQKDATQADRPKPAAKPPAKRKAKT